MNDQIRNDMPDRRGRHVLLKLCRLSFLFIAVTLLTGCFPSDDEGGVIGTGVILRGTVSEQKQLASASLEIRSQNGERTVVPIGLGGQYTTPLLEGEGPWLLRSDLGSGESLYGIGFAEAGLSHVHTYMDVPVRAWFLNKYGILDLDAAFDSPDSLPKLPSTREFRIFANVYLFAIEPVMFEYDLSSGELFSTVFQNDGSPLDVFLNANPLLLNGREINLVKTDPVTKIKSFYTSDLLFDGIFSGPDTIPPSMPGNFRVFGSASGAAQLVWDVSTDNSVVLDYNIYRNNEKIAHTPFNTYTDITAQPNTFYEYEVVGYDIAETNSPSAIASISNTAIAGDTESPAQPRQLAATTITSRQVDLTWIQDDSTEVAKYNIYRGTAPDDLTLLALVASERFLDTTIASGTDYWYAIAAVDASGNESAQTSPLAVQTAGVVTLPPVRQ